MPDYFLLGLLGHPLTHSLSPTLHSVALQFAELKGEYRLIDIPPKDFQTIFKTNLQKTNLQKEFSRLLPENLRGFNVTIPYKQDIYRLMSKLSPEATITGAVNTVRIESDGSWTGHNTDLLGFKESFIASFDSVLHDKEVLVIGAGGAARAVVIGLAQLGAQKIHIKARDREKVNSFIDEINLTYAKKRADKSLEIISADENHMNAHKIAAIINASPIGLYGEAVPRQLEELIDKLPAHCICFDLVYRKDKSKPSFARTTIARNLPTSDGLSMLAHQAKISFKYWTSIDVPTKVFLQSLDYKTQDTLRS